MSLSDNYVGLSPLYCGRAAPPSGAPAWMATAGVALNKAVIIPGIAGGGGATMTAWGSGVIRQTTGELFVGPQAGHTDGSYNGVTSVDLMADVPGWITRAPGGTPTIAGQLTINSVNWNADGKPVARHLYDHMQWCATSDKMILLGGEGFWEDGGGVQASDAFDPVTNTWSTHNEYEFISGIGYGIAIDQARGRIWTNGRRYFDTTAKTYGASNITGTAIDCRYPMKHDTARDQMFALLWGTGGPGGASNVLNASKLPAGGGAQVAVTFNASAAYTQFVADALLGYYAAMDYDAPNDVFYWYAGNGAARGRVYVIHPNNSNVWDMTLFTFASGSATLDATQPSGAGINGRLKYHALLKGFVINPSGSGDWFFIKTSN